MPSLQALANGEVKSHICPEHLKPKEPKPKKKVARPASPSTRARSAAPAASKPAKSTRAPAPAAVPIHQRLAKGAKKGEETAEAKKERKAAEAAKKAHDKAEKRKAQLWAAQEARSVTKLQSAFRGRLGRKEALEKAKLADALYPEEREKVNVVLACVRLSPKIK